VGSFKINGVFVSSGWCGNSSKSNRDFPDEVSVFSSIYLILPATLHPSNRNEKFLVVKGDHHRRLTTSPASVSRMSRQCEIPDISRPLGPPQPVTGTAILYATYRESVIVFRWQRDIELKPAFMQEVDM
jgi:hypothetical protein